MAHFSAKSTFLLPARLVAALFALLVLAGGCTKDPADPAQDAPDDKKLTAEKSNVGTYELVNLKATGPVAAARYTATFGSLPVELVKTGDSTLTFFVPEVSIGEQYLQFEKSKVRFVVAQTKDTDPAQLVTNLTTTLDAQLVALNPNTPAEVAEVNAIKQQKQDVLTLFNSLTPAQKRQTALFYEANKGVFKAFTNNVAATLDGPTVFRTQGQSNCPRTDFKAFYGCTADNLASAAGDLKNSSKKFLEMLLLGGAAAYLAPASFGLSAAAATLALGTAGYLLITEVRPAALQFKRALWPFLEANWIFGKGLYLYTVSEFNNNANTDLNLKPAFRPVAEGDGQVNAGTARFLGAMSALKGYWAKLTAVFGAVPSYNNSTAATTLAASNITVSGISNPNVQLVSQTGQQVKFKSLSGQPETFSYHLKVTKEGFVEEKDLTGKVLAVAYNYKLQIGDYNPDYTLITPQATYDNGQSVTLPNHMTQMVRLTLDGVPVKVGQYRLDWTPVVFGSLPTSAASVTQPTYQVTVYDATNNRNATITLNATFTNAAFARIVGQTITVDYRQNGTSGVGPITIRFGTNGTYTKTYRDGTSAGSGSYSFIPTNAYMYQPCSTYTIRKLMDGCISLPSESSNVFIPNFMYIYTDGTMSANSFYACMDSYQSWVIQ
ncbi:hypothetical protein F0P96_12925 [Hymenobacter busanensis]|uniref:Uncharacterized protein n=1 Tax=Hymenobacter busanensis TaxID=2607656 RepID=A0A7L4ZWB8_9BACT|nr:pilin [Hymenobacter busanensis]KAA9332370.1 hypothetical protein F0P96_12925 [Hymenobacter busanensis]QHJ07293.1 hypothetical protein GUY19_08350 [Hymenobacter busanensis]